MVSAIFQVVYQPKSDHSIVVLTGAGISQESGINPFRGPDGIYNKVDINEVSTPDAFQRNPKKVLDYYRWRLAKVEEAEPNVAHTALARLEKEWPGTLTLITQNVDDLHERANHVEVIHMHGEIRMSLCMSCQNRWRDMAGWNEGARCPKCNHSSTVRPNIVWFGEMPYWMEKIDIAIRNCDLFVSIGTSGRVYPASNFVVQAKRFKARTVELNLEATNEEMFDEGYYGKASEIVPRWVEEILNQAR